jgi:PAS domain S-box-containing protein
MISEGHNRRQRGGFLLRPRHIAAVALVLGLTIAGFVIARLLAERDARRESERRVAIADAQIRGRVEAATSLTASLGRFMSDEGARGVSNDKFKRNALRWLGPAGIPAAAWAEEVRAEDRAAYEGHLGRPIVAPDAPGQVVPPSSSYLPATLVSGSPPLASRGMDLRREPGIAAALRRAIQPGGVGATTVAARRDGTRGVFLVAPAPNLIDGVLRPGAVVVFLSEATLRAAARNPAGLQFPPADRPSRDRAGGDTVREEFMVAGQQFAVVMPKESVRGPGAVLPWVILAGGLLLAALAGALATLAARRARAQRDFDRIFNLSPDVVAVANFDGRFTRVNPGAEQVLGYTAAELLARPYVDFVHPDDRESTLAEAAAVGDGKTTLSFENRFVRKDGSLRVLEWTATPVLEDAVMYGIARDVTARRQAETESARLAAEQSALRRVAELVARQAPPEEVFALVTEELSHLLGVDMIRTVRFEPDGSATVVAALGMAKDPIPPGTNAAIPSGSVIDKVSRTRRPARVDDYAKVRGPIGALLREEGAGSAAGGPIVVDGRLWGAMVACKTSETLPPATEERVAEFAELVSTAISNIESRRKVERLAAEQSALRRVATLVARAPGSERLFSTVAGEVASVLDVPGVIVQRYEADGTVVTCGDAFHSDLAGAERFLGVGTRMPRDPGSLAAQVYETHRAARIDDFSALPGTIGDLARAAGLGSGCAGPIVVNGALWGKMCVFSRVGTVLPVGTENRLHDFIELVATAIANFESRAHLAASEARARELAEEQAALRRVATLVAEGATPNRVFDAVRDEVEQMFGIPNTILMRFDPDGMATLLATRGEYLGPVGRQWPLEGDDSAVARVFRTGRAARADYTAGAVGALAEAARLGGTRFPVAVPVVVDSALWGAMSVGSRGPRQPQPDLEGRLAEFTELLATAIANAEGRADLAASEAHARELASEQAALRRVAEVVAQQPLPEEVFGLVAEELRRVLEATTVYTVRFEPDGTGTVLAAVSTSRTVEPPGTNFPLPSGGVLDQVLRTGRAAQVDDYAEVGAETYALVRQWAVRSSAGGPIVVDGLRWGAMVVVAETTNTLPAGTEDRVAEFAGLVSTAISNVESRAKVERLAAEQAALRRVATLVAREHSPDDLFATLAQEVGVLLGVDAATVLRYEPDATIVVVAAWSDDAMTLPVGQRLGLEGETLAGEVLRTGAPRRKDGSSDAPGEIAAAARELGVRSAVGSPIVVEGSTWGLVTVLSRQEEPLPPDTESRLAEFSRVAGIAVANAKSRSDLAESRARIVRAGDEARRRFERDLHDGAQQRLVSLGLELRAAEATMPPDVGDVRGVLTHVGTGLTDVLDDLRELSRGLHPAVLSEDGLRPALRSLALRSAVPVDVSIDLDSARFEEPVEVAAYYVASEALTNTAKHAHASRVQVTVSHRDGWLKLIVSDDGRGGADPSGGSGLTGLVDRVEAIGGTIHIESSADAGTTITVKLPARAAHPTIA